MIKKRPILRKITERTVGLPPFDPDEAPSVLQLREDHEQESARLEAAFQAWKTDFDARAEAGQEAHEETLTRIRFSGKAAVARSMIEARHPEFTPEMLDSAGLTLARLIVDAERGTLPTDVATTFSDPHYVVRPDMELPDYPRTSSYY